MSGEFFFTFTTQRTASDISPPKAFLPIKHLFSNLPHFMRPNLFLFSFNLDSSHLPFVLSHDYCFQTLRSPKVTQREE